MEIRWGYEAGAQAPSSRAYCVHGQSQQVWAKCFEHVTEGSGLKAGSRHSIHLFCNLQLTAGFKSENPRRRVVIGSVSDVMSY